MCTCTSCEYTDKFGQPGFAEWPRGNPAGKRSSDASYRAHVAYSKQWGMGYSGVMHEPREINLTHRATASARSPERLRIPEGRWVGSHPKREWIPAPTTMREYIAEFEHLNGLKPVPVVKPTSRLLALAQELRKAA